LYFFGYGRDYLSCLRDYCKISGPVPVLPRWVLGNWWSRYWAYSQQELSELMLDFKVHQVPISVCITDMDWHLEGWTGYTWNRELFPDPPGYLKFLHDLGLHTALNLHPADGVKAHEEMYPKMAQAMGVDPVSKQAVKFDVENPVFTEAYFDILHHPMEEQGVDFWWMDWQQKNPTKLPGLNLLWWINHLHFLDLGREGKKRSFIFSRWGGLGNHRYPIGFSGDTVVSWDSLAFQPYFTATAANVGYGWWSHDIGGHMHGIEDAELYARWVQFGAFSPILRLHSTKNPFHERRPWGYDAETYRVTQAAMQLRHALIPYLYSMSWRNHVSGIPPILPMYYLAPDVEDAYACPNQYTFGSELIVAPVITPRDPDTRLARQAVWLPDGDWYDFFDGRYYAGGGWQALYGGLDKIPVFARAGAIIPLGPLPAWGGLDNPADLTVHVFPGADNSFDLYEDDGRGNPYLDGKYALTSYRLDWGSRVQSFFIEPVQGNSDLVPQTRNYTLVFHAVQEPQAVDLFINNKPISAEVIYTQQKYSLKVDGLILQPVDRLEVKLRTKPHQADGRAEMVRMMLKAFHVGSDVKNSISSRLGEIINQPELLESYQTALTKSQIRALFETSLVVGWNTFRKPEKSC
jgi:alpha-glucosidase (family GH31 glycosyl hydrolase)